jgi:hypothetical protein
MRFRPLAVSTILALTGAGLTLAGPAATADSTTLFVSTAAGCSDSGPATAAEPLCTIQAAADQVLPGQTVQVEPGAYIGAVTLARSGTPDAPITFTSTGVVGLDPTSGAALTITGAHDVVFDGSFHLNSAGTALAVADSSRVTVRRGGIGLASMAYSADAPDVALSGSTSQVTLTRELIAQNSRNQVSIGAGVSGTVLSDDVIRDTHGGSAVTAVDAPGTVMVNNTVLDPCTDAIHLAGASTGSTVENNVLSTTAASPACAATTDTAQVSVDADAATGTTLDYNLVHPDAGTAPYQWAGTAYPDPAALEAATGQGVHDLDTDPLLSNFLPTEGSPAIDSADATAADVPDVDYSGHPRVDDPLVANTGTGTGYLDRGAFEVKDPIAVTGVALTPAKGPYPLNVTATASTRNPWSSAVTYTFDFGDGTAPVTSDGPTATHTYTSPVRGEQISVTATAADGQTSSYTLAGPVVTAPAPLTPHLDLTRTPADPLTVTADTSNSTDPWQITDARIDFGDGTAATDTTVLGQTSHTYVHPGRYTFTLAETDFAGATAKLTQQVTVGSSYVPDGPVRILDTRNGTGTTQGIVPAGGTVRLKVTGTNGVPATGVTAVVLNLTATAPTASGYTTAHPGGTTTPTTSNLNYTRGQTLANQVTVPVATDGTIALTASTGAAVHLIADLQGYYTTNANTTGATYTATPQTRLLDTRQKNTYHTGPVASGQTITLPVAQHFASNSTLAVLRVTATAPTSGGYLTAYAGNLARPAVSTLNFTPGQTVSNLVITPVGPDGTIKLYNSTGKTQVLVDLVGSFTPATDSLTGNPYTPTTPTRILDTRNGTGVTAGTLGAGKQLTLKVAGTSTVPTDATAVLVNLTATDASTASYLTAYPNGTTLPNTSTLNITTGHTVPTLTLIPIGTDGSIHIYNSAGTTNVIADLEGYYTP